MTFAPLACALALEPIRFPQPGDRYDTFHGEMAQIPILPPGIHALMSTGIFLRSWAAARLP
jgi:hypothetical protein